MTDKETPHSFGRVLIEGQFCGFASLAIVNRHLALALIDEGVDLRLLPTDRSEGLAEVERLGLASRLVSHAQSVDIHLRNAWPPETQGMAGRKNGFICWAWEESEISPITARRFNQDLDLIMTTSSYVSEALKRSGVVIPVPVVGNGVDHFQPVAVRDKPERRRLLHVSTCLPRKAPEALVKGFVDAFQGRSDVELYIKTSPNPHNRIRTISYEARAAVSEPPPVVVDDRPLPFDELNQLYAGATAVVMASRGEGFGLPLAEAMMMGVPVVATRVGGQADFCRDDTAFLVESQPARSTSHVASIYSLWEDPSAHSVAQALLRAVDDPQEAASRAANARQLMQREFTWKAVARRAIAAMSAVPEARPEVSRVISDDYEIVSTWDEECGIATYSQQFYGAPPLRDGLRRIWARRPLAALAGEDDPRVDRSWGYDGVSLQRFADKVGNQTAASTLWFQHHPGYFSAGDMRTILPALRRNRSRLIITLHNVSETLHGGADWLHDFDKVVAHSAQDVEELGRAGIRGEVLPHGVNIIGRPWRPDPDHFTVGSFGFLTAHKNIELLVMAVAEARRSDPRIRLVLANSLRRDRQSRVSKSRIEFLIKRLALEDVVSRSYAFLSDEEIVERLAPCDVLAFPYGESLEGASGAARMAVALDRPTLLSTSGVFKDLLGFSHVVRTLDVETLAEAILALANDEFLRTLHDPARRRYAQYHHWDVVAARAVTQIMSA